MTGVERLRKLTMEAYHRRPEWSHSQIEVLIQSPPLFHGRYITGEFPRETTEALEVGTVVHDILSGGKTLEEVVVEIPAEVLDISGARRGRTWIAWSAANQGKAQLKAAEIAPIRRMVENVKAAMPEWLLAGELAYEHSLFKADLATGLALRARPDLIALTERGVIIVDFKTTRACHPRQFAADAFKFGYHRQAAWYWDAVGDQYDGLTPAAFMFVAVDKSPAHSCWLYSLKPSANAPEPAPVLLGRQQNHQALHELKRRLDANDWLEPAHGQILELDLPAYAYRQDPFALEGEGLYG